MSNNLADVSLAMDGFFEISLFIFGIMFIIYGIYSFGLMIFRHDAYPEDLAGSMIKSLIFSLIGSFCISSNMNDQTLGLLKYIGMGAVGLVFAGIIGGIVMVLVNKQKYKNYVKKTNELLLLTDDFFVLSTYLQTIEDQIALNSKMAEDLNEKKKEELTFLNSLLTDKRGRFNGMVADIRSSISL